ncbi:MAG: AAA family ATPase [Thiolinea sp.]
MKKPPNLPIGIQSFSELRTRNMLYVDKTRHIHRLVSTGKYYFLSRPRRFGKSLTLSTIRAIYEGQQALFSGLWIEKQWNWEQTNPVIHLSFSSIGYRTLGLEEAIDAELQAISTRLGITLHEPRIDRRFEELIRTLSQQAGKVVLLIDEYDKPLIDYLDDIPRAKANQQIMKTFYSVIKDCDPYLEFLLITGVSKFSKVSIFSDLNHLKDLTFDRHASTLTGYTQAELEHYFTPYMPEIEAYQGLSRPELLEKMRKWYNGYSWDAQNRVYNPFSILNFFSDGQFRNYWFETGTPTFLLELLREQNLYKLDNLTVPERSFSSYDIEYLQAIPILFQTGYLTIKTAQEFGLYTLDYPNSEVRESLGIIKLHPKQAAKSQSPAPYSYPAG